jgi:uncharacterized protein (DUF58 family)
MTIAATTLRETGRPRGVRGLGLATWHAAGPWVGRLAGPLTIIRLRGWGCLAAALASWILGSVAGWAEFRLAAVFLLALVLVGLASTIGRTTYAVTIDLARLRVKVGEQAQGQVSITNSGRRSVLPARIELPVGHGVAAFGIPRLGSQAQHVELFRIPTSRRAVLTVGPVRSARGDGLGLARRDIRWTDPHDLYVHPLTIPLDGASVGFLRDLEGRPTADLSSSDVAFHALREYTVGDDRRHIHWRTSARVGRLMVRQFEETRRSHLVVVLPTNHGDFADEQEQELAISVAASLGLQAIKEERDLTVACAPRTLHTETGVRLLDDCSRLDPAESHPPVETLAATASALVPDASVAFILVGSTVSAARLRTALVAFSPDVITAAVRCCPGEDLVRRPLGDSTALTVGHLDDLGKAVRSL